MADIDDKIKKLETLLEQYEFVIDKLSESDSLDNIADLVDGLTDAAGKQVFAGSELQKAYSDILQNLKDTLGAQFEYQTAKELELAVTEKILDRQIQDNEKLLSLQRQQLDDTNASLKAEKRVLDTKNKIVEADKKIKDLENAIKLKRQQRKALSKSELDEVKSAKKERENLEKNILRSQEESAARARLTSERQKEYGVDYGKTQEEIVQKLEDAMLAQQKNIDTGEDEVGQRRELKDLTEEQNKEIKNQNAIIDNTIAKMTGLKVSTGGFLDLILDNIEKGKDLDGIFEQFQKRLELVTNPVYLLANAFSFVASKLDDLSKKINEMNFGIKSTATSIIELPITFVRDTGLAKSVAEDLQQISKSSAEAGFLISETDVAFRGLSKSMASFTRMSSNSRKFLTNQAALLSRAGVSADIFGKSVEGLMKANRLTDTSAARLTDRIATFGQVVGMGANNAVSQLAQNLDLLATFGVDRGVEIFQKLAIAANEAGVEIKTLTGIADKFETFDSAMRAAGKLNFILKGPFLNSMELLKATPEETLQLLRDGFDRAGKSFDDFGRRGREAIASTLGVSVDVAKRLFDDRSIKSAKELENNLMAQARAQGSLTDEMKNNLTLQQKQELVFEKILQILMPLSEMFYSLQESLIELADFLAPVLAGIGFFTSIVKAILPALLTLMGIKGIMGVTRRLVGFVSGSNKASKAMAGLKSKTLGVVGALASLALGFYNAYKARETYMKSERTAEDKSRLRDQAMSGGLNTGLMVAGALAMTGVGIPAALLVGAVAGGAQYAYTAAPTFDMGSDYVNPQIPGGNAGFKRQDVAMGFLGDQAGVMTPYTEGAVLPVGSAVLNSSDVGALTTAVRAVPSLFEAVASSITSAVENANVSSGGKEEGNQELNLVIKMNEREIGKISQKVAMQTLRRGMEVHVS